MQSQVVQIPVLKQGVLEKSSWSTRILTIDVATATVTISRKNHPKNVLYHSMMLDLVQMWPHFAQSDLESCMQSMNAKMTLRLIGKVVPVPDFSSRRFHTSASMTAKGKTAATANAASATAASTPSQPSSTISARASAAALLDTAAAGNYRFTPCDKKKRPRSVDRGVPVEEVWMIRFTAYQAYELALVLIDAMRDASGKPKHLLVRTAEHDLEVIRKAWIQSGGTIGINAETALF